MVICAFCKQEFPTVSSLNRHMKTAKYCNTGKEKNNTQLFFLF